MYTTRRRDLTRLREASASVNESGATGLLLPRSEVLLRVINGWQRLISPCSALGTPSQPLSADNGALNGPIRRMQSETGSEVLNH